MKRSITSLSLFSILASMLIFASCEYKNMPFEHGKKIYRIQSINDHSIIVRSLDSNYRIGDTLKLLYGDLGKIVK